MTSSNRRLRLAILGCGAASQWYYLPATQAWSDRLNLAAVCDLDSDRAQHFGEMYGADRAFTDYQEMLTWGEFDAVAVVTPHAFHADQCTAAAEAGKHIFVEKPLSNTLAEASSIVSLADEKGLHVSCAPPNMLHPGQRRLMQIVGSGAIGKVCLARASQNSTGPGSRPGAPTDFSWFYQSGAGGMSSMAGYGLIRLTGLLGPVKALSAMAVRSIPERVIRDGPAQGKRIEVDVADNNVMVLDFGDDILGSFDTGYVAMASNSPSLELFGTDGVISVWGGDQVLEMKLYKDDWQTDVAGWTEIDIPDLEARWSHHASTLLSLADAVLDGTPLPNNPWQMVHIVEIMEKTWASSDTGQKVDLTTTFEPKSWQDLPYGGDERRVPPVPA